MECKEGIACDRHFFRRVLLDEIDFYSLEIEFDFKSSVENVILNEKSFILNCSVAKVLAFVVVASENVCIVQIIVRIEFRIAA